MAKLTGLWRTLVAWCVRHKAVTITLLAILAIIIPVQYASAGTWSTFLSNPLDATAMILASLVQNLTAMLGKIMLLLIELIVIPILGYNGFYNSNITNLGWSLVRDIVNMFVVVVLIVIAVMTIVGYKSANWAQQLPRLFIAIVLVNFSKLICGFLIDISQVVMFTFVNAVISIAAGNFAAMFGLSTFGEFSADFIESVNEDGSGMEPFMYLGAAYFQFVIYLAILAVLFLLAIAFIWRIIMLWVLIIMSPLAFFMIGIKDLFGKASEVYSKWWSQFSSALIFGPTLTFFLWLALAASAGSTLAQTEDFPMPEKSPSATNLPLKMFSADNFLGMLLALAILIAGMQQASSAASSMGGWASSMLSDKKGISAAKWLAKSPFKAAGGFKNERAWASQTTQNVAKTTGAYMPGLTKGVGNLTAKIGSRAAKVPGLGWAGNAVAAVGGNIALGAKEARKADIKQGAGALKERTDDQTKLIDAAAASPNRSFSTLPQDEQDAYLKSFGTDKKRQEKFKKNRIEAYKAQNPGISDVDAQAAAQKDHDAVMKRSWAYLETDEGKGMMDDTEKDRLQDVKFANMHLLVDDKDTQADADKKLEKIYRAQEEDGRANVSTIGVDAIKNSKVGSFLQRREVRREKGKPVSARDDILLNGKGTAAQREAMVLSIKPTDVSNYSATGVAPEEKKRAAQNVASIVSADRIPEIVSTGAVGANRPLLEAIRGNLGAMGRDGQLTPQMQGKATVQLMTAGYTAPDVLDVAPADFPIAADAAAVGEVDRKLGALTNRDEVLQRIDNVIDADASNAAFFDDLVPQTTDLPTGPADLVKANEVTKRIANVSAGDIDSLYKADPDASPEAVARKAKALSIINRAISAQLHVEDQKAQAADRLRKTQQDVRAAEIALRSATEKETAAGVERTAATAALATKATRPVSEHAAIDLRAASADAELTRATTLLATATAQEAAARAKIPAAEAVVVALGRENKREMKRLVDLHARLRNTGGLRARYTPTGSTP